MTSSRTSGSRVVGSRPAARRDPAERSPDLAHLSIGELRSYRHTLGEEENRVSYWRRLIQARLDVVRAGEGGTLKIDNLRNVLAAAHVERGRRALITVVPIEDIPPLPDLAALWDREPRPNDAAFNEALANDLAHAEAQLSAYRSALHQRIAAATDELIARYREHPDLCLLALPKDRARSARQFAQTHRR